MNRRALLCACAALASAPAAAHAQEAVPRLRERDVSETPLNSSAGRAYRILMSVPRGPAPEGGFPVIYVLDGDAWFATAVEVARMREWGRLTTAIVVGVGYPSRAFFDGERRNYDFTPPGFADPEFEGDALGGADQFLAFLNTIVRPWVGERHAIDPARQILFGHSMGAMLVLHAMYVAPENFSTYLAASAPIRMSDRLLVREAALFEAHPARATARALLTVGEFESGPSPEQVEDYRRYFTANADARGGLDVEEALRQLFPVEPGFDKSRELRQLARRLARTGAEVSFLEFAGDTHTSSAITALNHGIAFGLRPRRD